MVDRDMCRCCEKRIEEHETIIECPVCLYTMHTNCFAEHNPCPDGWNKKKLQLGDLDEPELSAPVTPPSGQQAQASAIFATFQADYEKYNASIKALNEGGVWVQYVQSPGMPCETTFGTVPLAHLGTLPSTAEHAVFAVQYGKPRDADNIKLLAFPKPGMSFEKWWDHALDSISSSSSYCTEAYRWALKVQKPDTTFETRAESGSFVRLDAILLTALMECIPGDTHLLRQEIKKAKTSQRQIHERNITGRQVLFMV